MDEDDIEHGENVSVSMKLTGKYDDVIERIDTVGSRDQKLGPFVSDVDAILETIERLGGGTRSAISEHLPADMAVEYDAERVVAVLHVLELYGFVSLEGNTWNTAV